MGCDGGVIVTNRKFLRGTIENKRPGRLNPGEVHEFRNAADARAITMSQCALSGEKLTSRVMACELGKLFNKEVICNHLLDQKKKGVLKENPKFKHIQNLKALTNCIFTPNPDAPVEGKTTKAKSMVRGETATTDIASFICPITLLEMNGRHTFFIHRPTGYIISEKAIKEVGGKAVLQTLLGEEDVHFDKEDLTLLAPDSGLEFDILKQIEERRKKAKLAKKAAKETALALTSSVGESSSVEAPKEKKEKRKRSKGKEVPNVKRGKIVNDALKLLHADKSRNKVLGSLFHKEAKKMTGNDMMMIVGGQRYTLS